MLRLETHMFARGFLAFVEDDYSDRKIDLIVQLKTGSRCYKHHNKVLDNQASAAIFI